MEENKKTYQEAGVNVSLGDKCSQLAYNTCTRTYKNRKGRFGKPQELAGGFSGPVKVNQSLEDSFLVKNSDGVGSKVLIAQRMDNHRTVAFDLVAMTADDTVSIGAEPFVGTNSLDVKEMDPDLVGELMSGLEGACKQAGVAMVGGEIAELREQIAGYRRPYIWNADLIGVLEEEKFVSGRGISPGDEILAMPSNGIRSNGLTLARDILRENFGDEWHEADFNSHTRWGEILLKPSRIYCDILLDILGRYGENRKAEIKGLVHITGGGILNLKRVLPQGLKARVTNPYDPQPEFLKLQQLGPVSDREAYKTWNMGQCFLVISPEAGKIRKLIGQRKTAVQGKIIGEIVEGSGVELNSLGIDKEKISY